MLKISNLVPDLVRGKEVVDVCSTSEACLNCCDVTTMRYIRGLVIDVCYM